MDYSEIIDNILKVTGLFAAIGIGTIGAAYAFIKKMLDYYTKKCFKDYREVVSSRDFFEWKSKVIQKLFPKESFVFICGRTYPVVTINSTYEESPFDNLEESSLSTTVVCTREYGKKHNSFRKLLSPVIRNPDNVGYSLQQFNYDEKGNIKNLVCRPCTFEQHVRSSHYLEYELYANYKKNKQDAEIERLNIPHRLSILSRDKTLKELLGDKDNTEMLDAHMIATQCCVLYKDIDGKKKLIIAERSDEVAYSPRTVQAVPSGFFDTFTKSNKEWAIAGDFSPKLSIAREFLEELFDIKEFSENTQGAPRENIYRHKIWQDLEGLINNEKARFVFLGSAFDLVVMTNILSYLLIIEDDEFFVRHTLRPNYELTLIDVVAGDEGIDFKDELHDKLLMPETAGLFNLVNKYLKEGEKVNEDNKKV